MNKMHIQDMVKGMKRRKSEAPLSCVTIDAETRAPDNIKDIVKREMAIWEPKGNVKDKDKIKKQKEKYEETLIEKSALLNEAPICTISIYSEGYGVCLSAAKGNGRIKSKQHENAYIYREGAEEKMLIHFSDMLNKVCTVPTETTEGTMIMGHNIINFDLPKLRLRCSVNRIPMPDIICCGIGEQDKKLSPAFDTMKIFTRFFNCSNKHKLFISLDEACNLMGIESPKNGFSGADVPKAWEDEKYSKVEEYCLGDAKAEEQVALLLMNKHPELI